ncbi:hypothetical protein, partial [Candidatus Sarmatiella mevalonica]|uniref:hypothetical protein n=1 Tax=Candidatus Sarmatiella mevalonica TaxID=2770581 RepID=UPI001A928264
VRQLLGNHVNIREQITNPLMEKIIANKSVVSRAEVIEASKGISAALCNAYQSRQSIIKNMNSIYDKINAGNCKNRDDVIKFYGDLYNLAQGVFGLSDYADGRWCTHETVHANLRFIYLCDSLVSSIDENLEKILA